MGYKTAYREVMRIYETDRSKAETLLAQRKEDIYQQLPRVQEIDTQLTTIGLSLVKQALAAEDPAETVKQLRAEAEALRAEREQLFIACGVPEDYFTSVYRCPLCHDTGYVQRDTQPERCRCLKQRLIDKYYDLSNLKDVLKEENFDTFDLRYYSTEVIENEGLSPHANIQTVYRTAMQFVTQFGEEFQNLLLYGETGLGKTFLCNCIAKDLLDRSHTVLYVTAPKLFKIIEDYRFNRDEMEEPDDILEAVTDVEVLMLDDLGAEFSTVVTSSALFDIINQRLLARKPTVISTNLSPSGLAAQYSERIVSRFLGYYKMLKFFGDDIRVKKKYSSKH